MNRIPSLISDLLSFTCIFFHYIMCIPHTTERVRGGRRQEAPVHQRLQRQRGDGRRHHGAAGALDGRPLLPAGGRRARLQLAPHEAEESGGKASRISNHRKWM